MRWADMWNYEGQERCIQGFGVETCVTETT